MAVPNRNVCGIKSLRVSSVYCSDDCVQNHENKTKDTETENLLPASKTQHQKPTSGETISKQFGSSKTIDSINLEGENEMSTLFHFILSYQ